MAFDQRRSGLALGISTLAVAVALTVATPAGAQTLSTIQGHVTGAAPGATVTATDANTGQVFTGTINAQGNYAILGVRPSNYHVVAQGAPAQDVTVPVGQTVIVDLGEPAPTGGGTEVVVRGIRGRKEVRTASVSTNVTPTQIENLPQNDRNFLNFAALAPGVQVSPSSGDRHVQAGAVSGDNINVFIDGLSLKNPVNHGGVAGQNFSMGNPFPQLAIQEFKVDTQNFKAEYEQAGSAIITAVTKTGGDEFHGDAFGEFQPKSFIGRPYFDRAGHHNNPDGTIPKPDYKRWQYGGDLGGPIIKDLLHFFVAFEATDQTLPSTNVALGAGVPDSISQQYNGSYGQDFKQRLYFGKLTLFATSADTINASTFLRRERNLRDYGGIDVPTHGHDISSNIDVYQLEWNHRGTNWLNEFTAAYNTVSNGTPRVSDGPEIVLTCSPPDPADPAQAGLTCNPNGQDLNAKSANLGANSFVQNDHQRTWTFKDNITLTRNDHVIKAGARVTFNKYSRVEDSQSNGTYYFVASTYTGFDTSNPYAAQVSTVPVQPASTKNTQIGLFVQDDWSPDEHWTINAGIRWDYETNATNENFVTPQKIVDALRAYPGWQAAGINPDDYISNGHNRHPYWKAFQPRLGVSYDVKGDRDLVFFGGAGRYYDRPLFITSAIETSYAYYRSTSTLTAAPGSTLDPSLKDVDALRAAAIAQGLGGSVWLLNNHTKLPYSDQFDIGVRKRFGQINASLTLSHIRSHNIFQFVRGNRLPDGSYPTVSETGEFAVVDNFPPEGQLPGFNGKLNIGANQGEARYWGLYAQIEKPYTQASGWGFTTTLTLQNPKTNDGTELGADEFFAGPDQNQFGWEHVQGVDRWRLVGTGIVGLPWGFTLSGTLTAASGPYFGSVIFYPDGTVFNGAGVYHPKKDIAYKTLDMRLAKTFKTPIGSFTADFQVYNLFDWVNRNYSTWGAGSGVNPTLKEFGTVGNARSFQAGLKYSF